MGKHYKRQTLMDAADLGLLHYGQIDPLLHFLEQSDKKFGRTRFNTTTLLMYLGALLAIVACSLFSTLAVKKWGMPMLLDMSLIYLMFAVSIAIWLGQRGQAMASGIFATLSIALVSLSVFALQHVLGFWEPVSHAAHYQEVYHGLDGRWLSIELATLLASALMLRGFRYGFLVMPLALTLWYMSMDILPPLLMQADLSMWSASAWLLRKKICLVFGLLMLLLALLVDLRFHTEKDYGYWLYLFGTMSFWGALSTLVDGSLSAKLLFLALNFVMILVAALLARRVFAVFGGIGMVMVLGDLSWNLFKDSFTFMVVLILLGFSLIAAGIWWSKHEQIICRKLRQLLPSSLQSSLLWRH